jgi:hypothetical protein
MNNNKQMAMMNECEICCEDKWAPECGANNNCNKRVCDDCFSNQKSVRILNGKLTFGKLCLFCFKHDYKRTVIREYYEMTEGAEYDEKFKVVYGALQRVWWWEHHGDECRECDDDE